MSSSVSLELKQRIKEAIDIVELVGRMIPLRRQGRLFVGLCPWHDDTHPSLQVNPERQSFKCWVCDIGGDVFTFVMKMEGVSFPEALRILADQAGIRLTASVSGGLSGTQKQDLYQAMAWAESQYHGALMHSAEAEPARRYVAERGLHLESIQKFRLGFAPPSAAWVLSRLGLGSPTAPMLEKVGVLVRSSFGPGWYDRFRGRLLFPIRDWQGRPIGFGGRLVPGVDTPQQAKYINSPETPLFTKSRVLYGLDLAKEAIRRTKQVLVMEGYMDCMMAHQMGFDNAVAVLGTALGEEHIRLLRRWAERIVLVLDGDEAGQRRASEVLSLFVSQNLDLWILTLPEGMDPCDFLLQRGPEAFARLLETETLDALEHAYRIRTRNIDIRRDIQAATAALESLLEIIACAPRLREDSPQQRLLREQLLLQRLAEQFRLPEQLVRNRLTEVRRRLQRRAELAAGRIRGTTGSPSPSTPGRLDPVERQVLVLMLRFPELAARIAQQFPPEAIQHPWARQIYWTSCQLAEAGQLPDFHRLLLEFEQPELQNLLVELDEEGLAQNIHDPLELLEALKQCYFRRATQLEALVRTASLPPDLARPEDEHQWLRQLLQQQRIRHGITCPTEGKKSSLETSECNGLPD
ncbi:MAG: DNA primase [Thermoguttaceae bacterium]|nr:DNA primase [Thermoguttaceae bacterium]MDW8038170.1 DNA primase [Thermoguttaceae bacterium]